MASPDASPTMGVSQQHPPRRSSSKEPHHRHSSSHRRSRGTQNEASEAVAQTQQNAMDEFDVFCRMAISPVSSMEYFQSQQPQEEDTGEEQNTDSFERYYAEEFSMPRRLSKHNLSLKLPSPNVERRHSGTATPQRSQQHLSPGSAEGSNDYGRRGSSHSINRSRSLRLPSDYRHAVTPEPAFVITPADPREDNTGGEPVPQELEGPKVVRVRSFKRTSKGVVSQGDVVRTCPAPGPTPSTAATMSAPGFPHLPGSVPSFVISESNTSQQVTSHSAGVSSSSSANNLRSSVLNNNTICQGATSSGNKRSKGKSQSQTRGEDPVAPIYRIKLVGAPGVGKSTLCKQFTTSEYLGAHGDIETNEDLGDWENVTVDVDGKESNLLLMVQDGEPTSEEIASVDGIIVIFAIDDHYSYQFATRCLQLIRRQQDHPLALVMAGNKSDLVRGRETSTDEGKHVAQMSHAKYLEISTVLNHRVDDLLVGLVTEMRDLAKKRATSSMHHVDSEERSVNADDGDGGPVNRKENSSKDNSATSSSSPGFFKQSSARLSSFLKAKFTKTK